MTTPPVSTKVQLLGPANATTTVGRYDFPADKRHQLLAYLACRGEWVTRERLADLFYPDLPGDAARTNLRRLLRRINEMPWLISLEIERGRLRWAVETDFAEFWVAVGESDLERVLRLYQGPLLRDLEGYEDNEFATWLMVERERAHGAWREAALVLARSKPASEATALYARLLAQDAFDEEAVGLYLSALNRWGRKREALRIYRSFADKLGRELGIEPSSATRQLVEAIEQSDELPALVHDNDPVPPASTEPPLPDPATSFVGRDRELSEVAARLTQPDCRLLTVLGPGGVGKSRLALQSASELARHFSDGCHFVALDGLGDPEATPAAIAEAVGLRLQGTDVPLDQIATFLGREERLLVLDNFEHLVEGAPMLATLLGRCPNLRLLATSRVRLELDAEWLLPLGGLALPPAGTNDQDAEQYDAVRLFINRAQRVQPAFRLGPDNVAAVLQICRLVEGYPLGIELAAAWARALPLDEIVREIEASLDFLNSSTRGVSERHRSVRATFEYSWRLLSESEQDLLAKLSVFRGGFTREAAAAVAGANLALLVALVDKSLLRVDGSSRYDFHPLVQQYAGEKLAETEHAKKTRDKHAGFFLDQAEVGEPELSGPRQAVWLQKLDTELYNLREALAWDEKAALPESGLRLSASLTRFWAARGYFKEGRQWLQTFLSVPDQLKGATRAKGLNAAGTLACVQGDYGTAKGNFEESLVLARALDCDEHAARALSGLGLAALDQADTKSARSFYQQSLAIARELEDRSATAEALLSLGFVELQDCRFELTWELSVQSLSHYCALENMVGVAYSLVNLALAAWRLGEQGAKVPLKGELIVLDRRLHRDDLTALTRVLSAEGDAYRAEGHLIAHGLFAENLRLWYELGDAWGVALSLEYLASLATAQADPLRAARLWGSAEQLQPAAAAQVPLSWLPEHNRLMAQARAQLGREAFDAAWAEGRNLELDAAVAYACEVYV